MHPAGLYVSREERDLVVVRTDLQGENPYEIAYHEYTHALFRLNFRDLPLWMNEGYAEFLGNTAIGEKEVQIGKIAPGHLQILRTNKFIPIETLFQVDENSPYYNEQNRTSVFYAESWALVHYLMLDPDAAKRQLRANFLNAYAASDNQIEAAQKTFGDLKKFSQVMEAYARQERFFVGHLKLAVHDDPKTYPSRSLSFAETQALRGIFFVYTQRPAEAEFAKAVPQTPSNYLPYYMAAMLRSRTRSGASGPADSLADLDKVIQMNPRFAPAYAVAANLYSRDPKQRDKALSMGKQAVLLDPANLNYAISYGLVLVNVGKTADANNLAAMIDKAAHTSHDRANLQALQRAVSARESYDARVAAYAAQRGANQPLSVIVSGDDDSSTPAGTTSGTAESLPPPAVKHHHTTDSFLEGTIQKMDCTEGDSSRLYLLVDKTALQFRVGDLNDVDMTSAKTGDDADVPPCSDWKGHRVKVFFRQVTNKDYAGDLVAIEFY
jgi:tetratricopeptide (TPR) repeat protein